MHDPKVIRGRFAVEHDADGWTVADYAYGNCVSGDTRAEAEGIARFARAYARRHGDVNMESFPYSLEVPLSEADRQYLASLREEN